MNHLLKNAAYILGLIILTLYSQSSQSKSISNPSEPVKYQKGYLLKQQDYIIEFIDAPVVTYKGDIKGLAATTTGTNKLSSSLSPRIDTKSDASNAYKAYLGKQRDETLKSISSQLHRQLEILYVYELGFNGVATKLTAEEAQRLSSSSSIRSIQLAEKHKAHTDRGPLLIQAPSAWNGTATGISAKGEGIVVGIIDTGIRADHPSFAETSPNDGYIHINPLGSGTFLGHCATNAGFCNNKLIGAYNFVDEENDPEDDAGHGTHVASTAAGNTLTFDLGAGNGFELTGVAPRANIIAYRIANEESATGTAILAAIDQAIDDGVDVINYSFGSAPFDPWTSSTAIAFRNARAAGIFVATSAGNDGPNVGTVGSPAGAPWITSVAASTHDRGEYPTKTLSNMTGGSSTAPSTITGRSLTGELSAPIVYAGDFSNGDTNPEQCLNPFPANTFNGEIVVCDRGEIARVQKAKNVADGGAGGYILANLQGGSSFLADDIYVIPGIHIVANDGDNLKAWLASGSGHTGRIDGTSGQVGVDPNGADIVAAFSSRGENTVAPDVIKPSISAPGVAILAAGIGEVDYTFLQGTSMASPHVAGAAALIMQLKPSWTPDQIHSAMVSTGQTNMRKENGISAADPFDIGGGRLQIESSLKTGLVLQETISNYTNANPSNNGIPSSLNLPSLADFSCSVSCSWTRTVTAVVNDTWTVSVDADSGLNIQVSPSTFTLASGENQLVTVTANISGSNNQIVNGKVVFTPNDNNVSTTSFPVAVKINNSNLPTELEIFTQRNAGQHEILGISAIESSQLAAQGFLSEVSPQQKAVAVDSDNSSAFDDLTDGVDISLINVSAGSKLLFTSTSNSSATDLDLFVGFDANNDGQVQESELLKSSTSSDANEEILILNPSQGTYWMLVQNWAGTAGTEDSYTSVSGVVGATPSDDISVLVPASSDGATPFTVAINYDNISELQYYGAISLESVSSGEILGTSGFLINRLTDAVSIIASQSSVEVDQAITVTATIEPSTAETRNYTASLAVPTGLTVDSSSLTNGATLNSGTIDWSVTLNGGSATFSFSATPTSSLAGQSVNLSLAHSVDLPNAKQESTTTSFSVTASSTGGGGGNTGGGGSSSSSSGGGSLGWMLMLFAAFAYRNKKRPL